MYFVHVVSKLIPPCPSGVHSDTPDFGKPFPALLAEVGACPVLPTAASPCPGTRFSGFALPVVIVHRLCSGGRGAVPAQPAVCLWDPEGSRLGRESTPGYGIGGPLAFSEAPGSPAAWASRSHGSVAGCLQARGEPLELRRAVSIHTPAEQPF